VIAHITGLPVEEALLPLLSGAGGGLLLARAWVVSRLRRPRSPRHDREIAIDALDIPAVPPFWRRSTGT
jgi:hypothetical protein